MSSSTTLGQLAGQLTNAVSGGNLVLNNSSVPSATFNWSLQTMGLTSLTIAIPDPATGIVYDTGKATLTITGNCTLYSGWNATMFTIVLSSGDFRKYGDLCKIPPSLQAMPVFNIQNISNSGFDPFRFPWLPACCHLTP